MYLENVHITFLGIFVFEIQIILLLIKLENLVSVSVT